MLRRFIAATVTVAAVVLGTSAVTPASASGTGVPDILDPVDGQTVKEWDGRWHVDFSDAPAGRYVVNVTIGWWTLMYEVSTTDDTTVVSPTHPQGVYTAGDVRVWVTRDVETLDEATLHVAGWERPQLVTPAPDSTTYDWDGNLTVDLAGARPGEWYVRVGNVDTTYEETRTFTNDAATSDDLLELHVPRPDSSGRIQVTFGTTDPRRTWGTSSFANVVAGVSRLRAHPAEFHPLVRDGYRDRTRLTYRLAEPARTRLVVRDDRGRRVWVDDLGHHRAGRNDTAWSGRATTGGRVAPGHYTVAVSTRSDSGHVRSDTTRVTVRRD